MTLFQAASLGATGLQVAASVAVILVSLKARAYIKERREAVRLEAARSKEFHERATREMEETREHVLHKISSLPVHCPHCGAKLDPRTPTPEA